MSEKAMLGDIIVIIDGDEGYLGKEFTVTGCPCQSYHCEETWHETVTWFLTKVRETLVWTDIASYKIISRKSENGTNTDKDVDVFLKRQRDKNLNDIFG